MRLRPDILALLRRKAGLKAKLTQRAGDFIKSDSGNFAMMFGLMFLPLMAAVGVAFDYSRIARAETILANALDSAILAVGKQLPLTEAEAIDVANNYLQLNLANQGIFENPTVIDVIDLDNKHVELSATNSLPTTIMQLFDQDFAEIKASAEVNKSFPGLEVVMVLDNTGSMSGQKITDLKAAATGMVNDLFGNDATSNFLRIGLVPFSEYVNIKTTTADYLGNVPNFGTNPSVDLLEVDPFLSKDDQDIYIATHYTGTEWSWIDITGEAKYNGWNVDDHRYVVSGGTGGTHAKRGDTFSSAYTSDPFEFRTVSPGGARYTDGGDNYEPCTSADKAAGNCDYEAVRNDHLWLYAQLDQFNVPWEGCVESRPIIDQGGIVRDYDIEDTEPNILFPDTLFVPIFQPDGSGGNYHHWLNERDEYNSSTNTPSGTFPRLYHLDKYYQNDPTLDTNSADEGPSRRCHEPLTPLVNAKLTLTDAIDDMFASYATNIPEALAWGWRVISPEEPFTAGLPYNYTDGQGIEWKKVIIVLTDGENWSDNQKYNSYGFWEENRVTGPTATSTPILGMNERLRDLCKNVKDASQTNDTNVDNDTITLYVIAFDMSSGIKDSLLKPCATTDDHFFEPDSGAELGEVFDAIGDDLAKLRLSK